MFVPRLRPLPAVVIESITEETVRLRPVGVESTQAFRENLSSTWSKSKERHVVGCTDCASDTKTTVRKIHIQKDVSR